MDTARQILRFSIPGSIFLLHGVACYLIYRQIQGVPFVESSGLIRENIAAVVAVLASIPVGFLIYQLYYFTYEPVLRIWPLPWRGRLVRRDRGGQILQTLAPDQIATLEKILQCKIDMGTQHAVVPNSWVPHKKLMHATGVLEITGNTKELKGSKERQLAYENLWYTHWDALHSAVDIAASYEDGEHVKTEYTTLSDIYHSLGATRTAVVTAWIAITVLSLSHVGRLADAPWEALGGLAAIFAMTLGIYAVLHVARGRTWRTTAASLIFGLRYFHWKHGQDLAARS